MRALAILLAAAWVGCSCQGSPHPVARLDAADVPSAEGSALGLGTDGLRDLTAAELKASGRFSLAGAEGASGSAERRPGVRMEVELLSVQSGKAVAAADARPSEEENLEVGVMLSARRKDREGSARYEFVGQGHSPVDDQSPEGRQKAGRKALSLALAQVVQEADRLLSALDKSDGTLEKELRSSDPKVRAVAIKVLAARHHPAASEALIAELKSQDVEQVRSAVGALVELKERKAVPALIDLARNKPPFFVREIVFALGALGGEEAEAYLFTVAQGSDQPEVQAAAEEALAELRQSGNPLIILDGGQP